MQRSSVQLPRPLSSAPVAASHPRAELEFFRGTWTVKGHEATLREVCDWLPGRGFMACNSEDRSELFASIFMSVFGYSDADGQYTYNGFSGSGSQRALRGNAHSGVWRFHGQSDRGPNWRRWQVTLTPTATGFLFREEVSDRSGAWRGSVALEYVRVADSPR